MVVMLDPNDDRIAILAAEVTGLSGRVDVLEVKVDGLGTKMDERFEQVDKRFERVEGELREHRRETKAGFEGIAGDMKTDLRQTQYWIAGATLSIIATMIGAAHI
ncbi:MAG TPA: hypothetical protein VHQ43_08210 [Solirubrobacterales bacterium]|jgi:hypothetical protein|nr:hypothetical protein [Solirubrobacterales bacterium]